jgi:DNA-3-methyladenine glycosylase II
MSAAADSVEALRASDPVLAGLMDRVEPVDFTEWRAAWSGDVFTTLARAIVGQQIADTAARAIFGRLVAFIDGRPPAAAIAAATDEDLRAVGLSRNKMLSLRDLAAHVLDGRLEVDRLASLGDDELTAQLTAVRGIGPWTAEIFLLAQLGRPDVLPAGDLGIRQAVRNLYGLDHVPTEKEVRAIGEHWHPNRSLATAYLYASLRSPDASR